MGGNKHFGWIAAACVGLAVLVAIAVMLGGGDEWLRVGSAPVGTMAADDTAGSTPAPGDVPIEAGVEATEAPPLPPEDTPLRLVLDDLQRRARAGEAQAQCRLAAEHAYCDDIRTALASATRMMEGQQARVARMEGEDRQARVAANVVEHIGKRTERLLERSSHCDGVPPVSRAEIVRQWRAAALSGSRPAMVHYAVGNAFELRDTLDALPELAVYRREAESIARRAASRGSVTAVAALAAAYWPGSEDTAGATLLTQAVEQDPVESLAMYLMLQAGIPEGKAYDYTRETRHVINDRVARLQAMLGPEDVARAVQRATGLQAEWGTFKAAQLDDDLLLRGAIRSEFPREVCGNFLAERLM